MAKKKYMGPKRKRMKRAGRVKSGKLWLEKYSGNNPVRGYARWYGVSRLDALIEFKQVGLNISEEEIQKERLAAATKGERRSAANKRLLERDDGFDDCNENHSFIAGYTSGGFAYGITWEEHDQLYEGKANIAKEESILIGNSHITFVAKEVDYLEALDGDIVQLSFDEEPGQYPFHRSKCELSISQNYEFPGKASVEWHDGEDDNGGVEVHSYRLTRDLFELGTIDGPTFTIQHRCSHEIYVQIERFLQREFGNFI